MRKETTLCASILTLVTKSWPVFEPPYLHSIHASAITCLSQFCDIVEDVFDKVESLSRGQQNLKFSTRFVSVDVS